MRCSILVLTSGLMLIANMADADELRDRANVMFKPIPERVSEVRDTPVSADQAELGINSGSIHACHAAT